MPDHPYAEVIDLMDRAATFDLTDPPLDVTDAEREARTRATNAVEFALLMLPAGPTRKQAEAIVDALARDGLLAMAEV